MMAIISMSCSDVPFPEKPLLAKPERRGGVKNPGLLFLCWLFFLYRLVGGLYLYDSWSFAGVFSAKLLLCSVKVKLGAPRPIAFRLWVKIHC